MRYENLIWDFDGTLFDTYPGMCRNLQSAVRRLGYELPLEEITRTFRISLEDATAYCSEQTGVPAETVYQAYRDWVAEFGQPEAKSFPGVRELLGRFQAAGGRNFVFTHRGKTVYDYLEGENLMPYFAEVVPFNSSFERKPSPSGNLYLMERHGLAAEKTLAIGDRELDILAGMAAGMDTCLLHQTGAVSAADYQLKDVEGLYALIGLEKE